MCSTWQTLNTRLRSPSGFPRFFGADEDTGKAERLRCENHVQQAQGQLAEAIATCGQVVDLNPFNIQAYQARAALREKTGDAAGAAEDLRLAADMAPEGTSEDIEQQVNQAYRNTNPFGM